MSNSNSNQVIHSIEDRIYLLYSSNFLTTNTADELFDLLEKNLTYNSKEDSKIKMLGKEIPIPRQQVAYGEPGTSYTFCGIPVPARDWNKKNDPICKMIRKIRRLVEHYTKQKFNFVLINRYATGDEYINYHADDEKDLDKNTVIVGVTVGAEREMYFKPKDGFLPKNYKDVVKIKLTHGSIIIIKDPTNKNWLHSIPKRADISTPRISLTFRNIMRLNKYD